MCCTRLKRLLAVFRAVFTISDVVILMAEASLKSSGETPIKSSALSSSGCLFCGTQQTDSRKRTSLKGKVQDLAERVAIVLDINISAIHVKQYLCNNRCYKKIKRLEKLQEEEKLLKTELKKSFASTNRFRLELTKEELNERLLLGEDVHNQLSQIHAAVSDVDQKILQIEERPSSFNIVLDNIHLKVLASDMPSDNQNKVYHCCNHNTYLDLDLHLENDVQTANLRELPNSVFLPSLDDQNSLLSDFVSLVGRVIVENLPAFAIFKDVIPLHMKHKYSGELKKKTETASDLLITRNARHWLLRN